MMRFAPPTFALLLAATGCTASPPPGAERSEVQAFAPGASAPATNTAQEPVMGGPWEELLRRLQSEYQVGDQQKQQQAEQHYRLAEQYVQSGDYDRAHLECQSALSLDANHAGAQALLMNINFIRNRAAATPETEFYRKIMDEAVVRHQQLLLEIDDKFARGRRHYDLGEYDAAEREFRMVLEYAKWMPTHVGLDTRRKQAVEWLERTKQSRSQAKIDEDKSRLSRVEEEKVRDEMLNLLEQRRQLETLFGQAQIHFEREEYERCIHMCDRILYIDPNLPSVQEMKMVALRLRTQTADRNLLRSYVENWKRTFENIELQSMVVAKELEFPERHIWEEIRARKPKGIHDELTEDLSPEDRAIAEKLKTIKIKEIDFQSAALTDVRNYLSEISGLNFVIDTANIATPESVTVSIKLTDIPLENALKLILQQNNHAHYVDKGVVMFTSVEAIKKMVRLELYDVQDLTYGLVDYPGIDISLSGDDLGTNFGPSEEGGTQQFDGTKLAELIQGTIDKDGWTDDKNIQFQNGLLIVSNTVDVHRTIRQFLTDLRKSTGVMVGIESRFLMVEDQWLQQIGMDLRDVNGPRAVHMTNGLFNLDDINPSFAARPQFVSPGGGLPATSAGFGYSGGNDITRRMGGRVQNIMTSDFLVERYYATALGPVGGASLQYTLMDDISLEAVLRLVDRSERSHTLTAPKLTLFNTQRGNVRIANQFAYIKDFDIQIATAAVAADPVPAIVHDGISLDVRPIVSADRKYVTIELRPTVAVLNPPPPDVFGLTVNLGVALGGPVSVGNVFIETPILEVQRLRTTVVVPDRGTLLIGGMTVFFDVDAESSIPVWRHIPILGNIGSNKVKGLQRRQFLILLRANIIIPSEIERDQFD